MGVQAPSWGRSVLRSLFLFSEAQGSFLAAGLCYFVLFSMFPMLLVLLAVAAHALDHTLALKQVELFLRQAMPGQAALLMEVLKATLDHRGKATLLGLVLLLWAAKGGFGAATVAMNQVWEARYPRSWWEETWRSLLLAVTAGAAIWASTLGLLTLSAASTWSWPGLGWHPKHLPGVAALVAQLAPWLGALLAFWSLHRWLPAIDTTWRAQWPGALAASLVWEGIRRGFATYLLAYGKYDLVYGPLASLIAFMVWIYLTGVVWIWGACLNRALEEGRRSQEGLPQGS